MPVTLDQPWTHKQSGITFPAGTYFVHSPAAGFWDCLVPGQEWLTINLLGSYPGDDF
jgi:hypothetical protein